MVDFVYLILHIFIVYQIVFFFLSFVSQKIFYWTILLQQLILSIFNFYFVFWIILTNHNNAFILINMYVFIFTYHTLCRRKKELEHASFHIFVIFFYKPISSDMKKKGYTIIYIFTFHTGYGGIHFLRRQPRGVTASLFCYNQTLEAIVKMQYYAFAFFCLIALLISTETKQ